MTTEFFSLTNPNPNLVGLPLKNKLSSSSFSPMASFSLSPTTSPFSVRLELFHRRRKTLIVAAAASFSPKGFAGLSLPSCNKQKKNVSFVSFAASQEDSVSFEVFVFLVFCLLESFQVFCFVYCGFGCFKESFNWKME